MRLAHCIAATALMLLASCGFDTRSTEYACSVQSDCSDGRSCELGWCVLAETQDAAIATDSSLDAMPPPSCMECNEDGSCEEECSTIDCKPTCTDRCDCDLSCTGSVDKCDPVCEGGSECEVDCGRARRCHPRCQDGAICEFDCTGVMDCKKATCEGTAMCLLDCTDTTGMNCKFDVCGGEELSCPGNIIACNRACP